MRKLTNLAVVSLACTLAAFGCTMNRMTGNGQSTEQTPEVGPANTSSTLGSSSATTNPPMASGAIVVDPTRPLAVDAQATLAADQAYQGRVLGAVSPPLTTQGNAPTTPTGQFANPVAPGVTGAAAVATTAVTTVPMSGDATNVTATPADATNSAISTMSNATLAAPTNSAIAPPAATTAPTATSTTSSATTTSTTVKTAKATTTKSKTKSTKAKTKATAAATTQPVHIETSTTGDVVMTNTTTNPPQH